LNELAIRNLRLNINFDIVGILVDLGKSWRIKRKRGNNQERKGKKSRAETAHYRSC
jgi:hypothetical protein